MAIAGVAWHLQVFGGMWRWSVAALGGMFGLGLPAGPIQNPVAQRIWPQG